MTVVIEESLAGSGDRVALLLAASGEGAAQTAAIDAALAVLDR
ncbi:MAG TPA: hypothetical protein VH063_00305 [Gaiellaceae bacterium]|nr:hypothetical protein [Gaiellaceae bacterium]